MSSSTNAEWQHRHCRQRPYSGRKRSNDFPSCRVSVSMKHAGARLCAPFTCRSEAAITPVEFCSPLNKAAGFLREPRRKNLTAASSHKPRTRRQRVGERRSASRLHRPLPRCLPERIGNWIRRFGLRQIEHGRPSLVRLPHGDPRHHCQ